MNTKFDSDIDVNANKEACRDDCTNPVRSNPSTRCLAAPIRRLGAWISARMKAHEDRVVALRVYSQHRLDGRVTDER